MPQHRLVQVSKDYSYLQRYRRMGKGFVLALSKKWKMPEEAYRQWYKSQEEFTLGAVQFVNVENKYMSPI